MILWNAGAYNPSTAWLGGLHCLGGSAWQAFEVFAANNYSSVLNPGESPTLVPLITAFWKALDSTQGLSSAALALSAYFIQMATAAAALTKGMGDGAFLSEAKPWNYKLGVYGEAVQAAVATLVAQQAGDGTTAAQDRLALESLIQQADAIPQVVAPGILDAFLARPLAASNR